jgi:hypothetical protein
VDRRISGADVSTAMVLQYITNINQTSWLDDKPASNTPYTYSLRQVTISGTDYIPSVRFESSVTVTFQNTIISLASDGTSQRAVLKYVTGKKVPHIRDQNALLMWGDINPFVQQSPINYVKPSGTFQLVTNSLQSATDMISSLRNLWDTGQTVCWRDDRKRRSFGLLSSFVEDDAEIQNYTVTMELTATSFVEGQ